MLAELRLGDAVAYSDGTLMEGTAGAGVAFRWLQENACTAVAKRRKESGQFFGIYNAELEGIRIALLCAASFILPDFPHQLHVIADNLSAIPSQSTLKPPPGAWQQRQLVICCTLYLNICHLSGSQPAALQASCNLLILRHWASLCSPW